MCEASLRAAFEPVLRVSLEPYSEQVHPVAFAQAMARITQHFAPDLVSPNSPAAASLLPLSWAEALELFRDTLRQLVALLERSAEATGGLQPYLASSIGAPRSASPCSAPPCSASLLLPDFQAPEWQRPRPAALACDWSTGSPEKLASLAAAARAPSFPAEVPQTQYTIVDSAEKSTMRGFLASAGPGEGGSVKGPVLGPLVPKTMDTPPTSMLFASLASPEEAEAPVTDVAPPDTKANAEEQELLKQLEASQDRCKRLQKALVQEEETIRRQAEEELRLRQLHQRLQRELPPEPALPEAASAASGAAGRQADSLSPLAPVEGPQSLAHLKVHLGSVKRLHRRVKELEVALDTREEQVIALTDQLQDNKAPAAAFTTASFAASTVPVAVRVV